METRCRGSEVGRMNHLTTETVQGTTLPLQRVDDIEGSDSLALCVLSVCDRIADNTFEEGLEDTTCFFVDHYGKTRQLSIMRTCNWMVMLTGRDTLDTASTGQTTDGRFCDTLDVVSQDLPVTLCTTLAEALATFAACEDVRRVLHVYGMR